VPSAVVFYHPAGAPIDALRERVGENARAGAIDSIASTPELERRLQYGDVAAVLFALPNGSSALLAEAARIAAQSSVPLVGVASHDCGADAVAQAMRDGAVDVLAVDSPRWSTWRRLLPSWRRALVDAVPGSAPTLGATHDALTGLAGRQLIEERIREAIGFADRTARPVAALLLDIDRFGAVNDSLGRDGGDAVLRTVGDRLAAAARGGDTLGRVGGDEFVLLCPDLRSAEEAADIAARVAAVVAEPIRLDGVPQHLTCTIGVGVYPMHADPGGDLLKCATVAASRAKRQGRGAVQFFTADMNASVAERVALERELREAIERGEFVLHYQPQVALDTGRVVGLETLIRWRHPERGLLGPDAFIALAEETGLIVPIGRWALREACAHAASLRDDGHADLVVAVNVSAVQVRSGALGADVRTALDATKLEPRRLELELTESAIAESGERFAGVLREIRGDGVRIAIDDFGTGYSSLAYLKRFPIDAVKIDQTFVRDIVSAPDDAAIVQAVIAMAHRLDLAVVAEGVEADDQAAFLRRCRCDIVQGYLFGRPVPLADLGAVLSSRELGPPPKPLPGGHRSVLFVDDEESVLRLLTRILRGEGYEMHTATTAEQGLQILARTPIAVVVSDQRLPGMSGTEFLRRVRALYPETVRIVLSGYADIESVTSAINDGAIYKFLRKPWEEDALRSDLRHAFRLFDASKSGDAYPRVA
jgi:diguanylate cyclase (GGDEF)-like protein